MGDKISIELNKRDVHGKKVWKLRAEGITPAVVYGAGLDPISVQVESTIAAKVFKAAGHHTPVHVTIDGKKKIAMIKDVDIDPVRHHMRHLSFHAVKQNQPVEAEIPIRLIGEGESEAERAGLVVLQSLDKIVVKALPMDLPEAIEISIVALKEAGERVTLADATLADGVEFVEHESGREEQDEESHSVTELVVASVYEPAALAAANDAAGGDAEDESEVESENGEDTPQDTQAEETKPGGKAQDEPKQSNVDANK